MSSKELKDSSSQPQTSQRLNLKRAGWYLFALAVFGLSGFWFCWHPRLAPVMVGRNHYSAWKRMWCAWEINPEKRLSTVPHADLNGVWFVNQLGWAVGDQGVILHTEDGGDTWTLQTGIDWGEMGNARDVKATISEGSSALDTSDAKVMETHDMSVGNSGPGDSKGNLDALKVEESKVPPSTPSKGLGSPSSVQQVPAKKGDGIAFPINLPFNIGTSSNGLSTAVDQNERSKPSLRTVVFVNPKDGWAAGDGGIILHTSDGGSNWMPQISPTRETLGSMVFVDTSNGWICGQSGTILHTRDGGLSWEEQSYPGNTVVTSISFADASNGWACGSSGAILHTADGGAHWGSQVNKDADDLVSIRFSDTKNGCAVGINGTILHTQNGGEEWDVQLRADTRLQHVRFGDTRSGWVLGEAGVLFRTSNGGINWERLAGSSSPDAISMFFENAQHGWLVGRGGTILHTADGGGNWSCQTANIIGKSSGDAREYFRLPALMFFVGMAVSLGLISLGTILTKKPIKIATTEHSIADIGVSDKPLTSREFDALEFGPLVAAIAGFLRNSKTTGPLTLAVVGEWGSGKSSLMWLLKEKLTALDIGIRPVWFNAWHHQDEQQLLAAFLESIRSQAVRPWYSPLGLKFRLSLINRRMRRSWMLTFMGVVFLAAFVALLCWLNEGGLSPDALLEMLKKPDLFLAGKLAVFVAALFTVYKFLQGFQAFGMDPATLLASVTEKAKLSDLGEQTSFRHRFAQEFADVTSALQPRTMTIFVDDLDRCEPKQMMQVMQTLNFLSSSGDCFLVLGMAETVLTNGVAFNLQDQFVNRDGSHLSAEDSAGKCWEYSRSWMEKLIQIRILVPSADTEQFKMLLTGKQDQENKAPTTRWWKIFKWLIRTWPESLFNLLLPWFAMAASAVAVYLAADYGLDHAKKLRIWATDQVQERNPSPTPTAWATNSFIQPGGLKSVRLNVPNGVAGAMLITNADFSSWVSTQSWMVNLEFTPSLPAGLGQATRTDAKQSQPGNPHLVAPAVVNAPAANPVTLVVVPGQKGFSFWWVPLVILPVLLIYIAVKVRDAFEKRYEDSDDFRAALERWAPVIKDSAPTPRSAKRLINKLRFYAMMTRTLSQAGRKKVPENAIVAFGVKETQSQEELAAYRKTLAARQPKDLPEVEKARDRDLDDLTEAMREHMGIFKYLRSTARFGESTLEAKKPEAKPG